MVILSSNLPNLKKLPYKTGQNKPIKCYKKCLANRFDSFCQNLAHRKQKTLQKLLPPQPIHLAPVHQLPEALDVILAAVLVLEVVGVLPYIERQHGLALEV